MGRKAGGPTVRWKRGIAYVRFTYRGHRVFEAITPRIRGESPENQRRAEEAAAVRYAEVVTGRGQLRQRPKIGTESDLETLFGGWLESRYGLLSENTIGQYKNYVEAHFLPFFRGLEDMATEQGVREYTTHRLRAVTRSTVLKERAALNGFLTWCAQNSFIDKPPVFPEVPQRATGKRVFSRKYKVFTRAFIESWLETLPEWNERGDRWPVRARFILVAEYGLRPSTLNKLRVPEHYTKGAETLIITDEIDKARFGRELPLTARARKALDSVCPREGLIFGKHDYTAYTAGVRHYDLRHSLGTNVAQETGNLPGLAYILGHKNVSTTNKYMHSHRGAAEQILNIGTRSQNRRGQHGAKDGN